MNQTSDSCRVLSRAEAASFLKISTRTLDRMHCEGKGPAQIHLSRRRLGYMESDLQDWLRSQREIARAA